MFQKSMGRCGGAATEDDTGDDSDPAATTNDDGDNEEEIAKLKRELAEMQQRLDSLSRDS